MGVTVLGWVGKKEIVLTTNYVERLARFTGVVDSYVYIQQGE